MSVSTLLALLSLFSAPSITGVTWHGIWRPPIAVPSSSRFHAQIVAALAPQLSSAIKGVDCYAPTVLRINPSTIQMWFGCLDQNGHDNILTSTSSNFSQWSEPSIAIQPYNNSGTLRFQHVNDPSVVFFAGKYLMYFTAAEMVPLTYGTAMKASIYVATSIDGIAWSIRDIPAIAPENILSLPRKTTAARPSVTIDPRTNTLLMAFNSRPGDDLEARTIHDSGRVIPAGTNNYDRVQMATSTDGLTWTIKTQLLTSATHSIFPFDFLDAPDIKYVDGKFWMIGTPLTGGVFAETSSLFSSDLSSPWTEHGPILRFPDKICETGTLCGMHNASLFFDDNDSYVFFGGKYASDIMTSAIKVIGTNRTKIIPPPTPKE